MHTLSDQCFKTTKCTVWSVTEHMSQQCARLCHATPPLWQVSKSQQVCRSIPWDSFNGDTWWGLWIREEMKDHPLSKQDSSTVTSVQSHTVHPRWMFKIQMNDYDKVMTRSLAGSDTECLHTALNWLSAASAASGSGVFKKVDKPSFLLLFLSE